MLEYFPILIACLLILRLIVQVILSRLNRRHLAKEAAHGVPEPLRETFDEERLEKTVAYTRASARFGEFQSLIDAIVLAVLLFGGLLAILFGGFEGLFGETFWARALTLVAIGWVMTLLHLPMDWYETFHLEERFGFNKTTPKLWWADKGRDLVVGFILGYPLLCLILWLARIPYWWLIAFAAVFFFQVIMIVIYPMFILPLYNKFEPLPEGPLRDRLMDLAERTGFRARTILVVDGSKRSGHSNAYFTGFGRFRRIVLYDTLIEQLEDEELEAVLAHEIGHYRLGHIPRMVLLSGLSLFVGFAILGILLESAWFYRAFGFTRGDGLAAALLLFSLLAGLFSFWLGPIRNQLSRRWEFQADRFARDALGRAEPLIGALRKLTRENLSNPLPHPAYSGFYYSHPTLREREAALHSP